MLRLRRTQVTSMVSLVVALASASTSHAQQPHPAAPPRATAPPAAPPTAPPTTPAPAPAPGPGPDIAPVEGPGSSWQTGPGTEPHERASETPKAQKIREEAKTAELTPIVPSPKDVTKPAYQLYAETDLPLLGIGLVMASTRLVRTQPAYCAPLCDKSQLNALDKSTAGFYDTSWSLASDVGLYSLIGGSAVLLVADEGVLPALNDAVVIAESALTATAVSSLATLAAGRPRPFLYGEKAPLDVRNSADAGLSFVSSHASVSFAIAVSTYITAKRLHPHVGEIYPAFILVGGLAAASFVATGRVMAGKHFVTDSIAGAMIGSSVGVLIPALHGSPVKVVPKVTSQEQTLQLVGTF